MRIARLSQFVPVDGDNCKLEDDHYVNNVAKERVLFEGFKPSGYVLNENLNKWECHNAIHESEDFQITFFEINSGKFDNYVEFFGEQKMIQFVTHDELFEILEVRGVELIKTEYGKKLLRTNVA